MSIPTMHHYYFVWFNQRFCKYNCCIDRTFYQKLHACKYQHVLVSVVDCYRTKWMWSRVSLGLCAPLGDVPVLPIHTAVYCSKTQDVCFEFSLLVFQILNSCVWLWLVSVITLYVAVSFGDQLRDFLLVCRLTNKTSICFVYN